MGGQRHRQPWESGGLGMTSQLMSLSSDFKEKNGWRCLAGARTKYEKHKGNCIHCYNLVKYFPSLMWAFQIFILTTSPLSPLVFYHICKNYKIGFFVKWGSRTTIRRHPQPSPPVASPMRDAAHLRNHLWTLVMPLVICEWYTVIKCLSLLLIKVNLVAFLDCSLEQV